jgi:RHS repeat-associated protein
LTTASNGTFLATHHYYGYGEEILPASHPDPERRRFTGHERDTSDISDAYTLDYMHARYYSGNLGRFTSVDPGASVRERVPQSWNRYAYVRSNPLGFIDPDGEEARLAVGLQTPTNYFGHVAIVVNDVVFSFGTQYANPNGDWGVPLDEYLAAQSDNRETDLITLDISTEQEADLLMTLEANNPFEVDAYDTFGNNCVSVCEQAFEDTGILVSEPGAVGVDSAGNLMQSGAPKSLTPRALGDRVRRNNLNKKEERQGKKRASRVRAFFNTLAQILRGGR